MMFANINGAKLFYDVDGASVRIANGKIVHKPVIFIVHGGPGGSHLGFKPYFDSLADHAQLVYVDQRGCGFSEEDQPENYTLDQNAEDIEALRKALGLEKIYLLGHSYGGMVAMRYATRYQKNLKGLLLLATAPSYRFLNKAKEYVEMHGSVKQKYYAEKLWAGSFQSEEELGDYFKELAPFYSTAAASGNAMARPKTKHSYVPLNKGFGGFMREFDLRDQLEKVDTRTLILAGRHDWITPVSENEEIHRRIPHSEFQVLERSSHRIFADEQEKTLQFIQDFLNEVH
ncbi:alpha/beta fold hydrolase [Virgibacillus sp. 179-BFC.A HS]|uniref:Alpha/beta fold hydrolase n=1 Tax=Tigheibacillus jepli TaxID=3035914 RepID=A0ABU5CEN4_9BACI|nr:alpha/beta fold hydrolase [Virgibacillus sp. 179-BFC.A HS]MDY0404796.1 alpha/beta fold hydrolase [Virgibacillus sp. 179-BFC.A HS]